MKASRKDVGQVLPLDDNVVPDDAYYPEIKQKIASLPTDYWATFDVKQDKNGQTIIVLYVGNNDKKSKSQFFIKPEQCQLSHDHKDSDPNTCLTKIEVTLKDRVLKQEYASKE